MPPDPPHRRCRSQLARELVDELLRTSLMLTELLGSLIDGLAEDAFPGEDNAAVVIEMVAGTCTAVVAAAGEARCREAIEVIVAVRERIVSDLATAARLAAGQP